MIGAWLSHYRIAAKLGAGGMGEVYRATDLNLGRDVAIKVLPEEVAKDAERLARFKREAQLLASLNHAHIASTVWRNRTASRSWSWSWSKAPGVPISSGTGSARQLLVVQNWFAELRRSQEGKGP